MYLYRAVDSEGNTIDFYLSKTRDKKAAKRFFKKGLFHVYERTPFETQEPVRVFKLCHDRGAIDMGYNNMPFEEPVHAVEPGVVVHVTQKTNCFSTIDSMNPTRSIPPPFPPNPCFAHNIVIRGSDGSYTEYAHVNPRPEIVMGFSVQAGTLIGNVDNSGNTTGAHVHLARYLPDLTLDPAQRDNFWYNIPDICAW